jgi:hypothetical protein
MADNRTWDSLEFPALDFPYNKILRELAETPRLVGGYNSYITPGGKLQKRPGTIQLDSTITSTLTGRVDRYWLVETLDPSPYIYIVASVFQSGSWNLQYIRYDAASPAWTSLGNMRQINASTAPHEGCVSRGVLYLKGYPTALSGEVLGSVLFDGTGGTPIVRYWGLLGPTTPAAIQGAITTLAAAITSSATTATIASAAGLPAAPFNIQIDYELITVVTISGTSITAMLRGAQGTLPAAHNNAETVIYRNWTASAHPVAVNLGWSYSYSWVTTTGQVSNRAPIQTVITSLPSNTGPFLNLIPAITVQGNADTTNIPTIRIWRITDGGGTYMFVQDITNTGAGNITYQDKSLTGSDPIPDANLNSQNLAPSLTSNGPPPTVLSPLVVGVATPAQSTPIAYYAGRLWFGMGNVVFFSANEELNTGIPEESWPSGTFGNFYRFQYPIVNVRGTSNALYIITTKAVYELTGTTLDTFNVLPLLSNVGGAQGHPRALDTYQDSIVWLTNDLRVGLLQGRNYKTLSIELGTDYVNLINQHSAEMDIHYWAELDREWITLTAIDKVTPSNTRMWVYDVNKSVETEQNFWQTPWSIPTSAVASGRARETQQQRRLVFFSWNGTTGFVTRITSNALDIVGTDDLPGALASTFDFKIQTGPFQVPPGNHVNALRRPGLLPIVYDYVLERTVYPGDVDPVSAFYLNDITYMTGGTTYEIPVPPPTDPTRDSASTGYKTMLFPIEQKGKRLAIEIDKFASKDLFELQNMIIRWSSDAGSAI